MYVSVCVIICVFVYVSHIHTVHESMGRRTSTHMVYLSIYLSIYLSMCIVCVNVCMYSMKPYQIEHRPTGNIHDIFRQAGDADGKILLLLRIPFWIYSHNIQI